MQINILFNNCQNIVNFNDYLKNILRFCCYLVLTLEKFNNKAEISLLLTDNEKIKMLNSKYKNKSCETDVLSFSTKSFGRYFKYGENIFVLGDVVISVEKALEQFKFYGSKCLEEEIARLLIHAMLHLLGYDHEKSKFSENLMKKKEKVLNKIVKNKFKFERVSVYERQS